jgi:phosphoglycerol transferase MdoB-like AlkP superfamily enzyme
LPKSYDAKTKTSIDFAPSLLHYLGIDNRKNSFVGESIFETDQNRKRQYGVVSADHLMVLDGNGSYFTLKDSKNMESTVNLFNKYVRGVKHYEMKRRIWPADFPQ